ncbi:chromate efflux transporter [Parvibaculum sp.]|jgi:chromate transporter|uniref:chromate efflux transporter n=2 Tax=Parvibaculum TaxID=256616 RepID=UPI000C35EE90|nr:chromate efflux transporter [Parvibaculum sp.]MAM93990.1 chromate transporter [Parvibaculum sp.]|tara:strand:- start:17406 stop:18728 length:1323 start_codon:yes stop_codon:yes gene_type:complete
MNEKMSVSFGEAFRVWTKIGLLSFGGPAGQIALMHRVLVEEKKWLSEPQFLHALNFCMLLPGPEAQQLATYSGWLLHGVKGGLAAGLMFILPGVAVMLGLSMLYGAYAELAFVEALFFGIKAAVFAIVIEALIRISKRVMKTGALYGVAGTAFAAIFFLDIPFPLVVLGAALFGFAAIRVLPAIFGETPEREEETGRVSALAGGSLLRTVATLAIGLAVWLGPVAALLLVFGANHVFTQEAVFFSKMAVVTFGGAYAVLAYVAQEAVQNFGWLNAGEMLDGLGLAETTPGPLIMVLQFVGYLGALRAETGLDPMLAGVAGAFITTWVTFAPCFLWIFLGAPYLERVRNVASLNAAFTAITAAVVGVILNLAVWFGLHVLFGEVTEVRVSIFRLYAPDIATLDLYALGLSAAALVAVLRFKAGMLPVLGIAAGLGLAIRFF